MAIKPEISSRSSGLLRLNYFVSAAEGGRDHVGACSREAQAIVNRVGNTVAN
jgi:hypothetical protein